MTSLFKAVEKYGGTINLDVVSKLIYGAVYKDQKYRERKLKELIDAGDFPKPMHSKVWKTADVFQWIYGDLNEDDTSVKYSGRM